jgi:hypothetical protein
LSATKPYYVVKAGLDLRVIYTMEGEAITVLDVMRKETMDFFMGKKKKNKSSSPRKRDAEESVKRAETNEVEKS